MARYYASKDTTPISQFVELPLDFMQDKLTQLQLENDAAKAGRNAKLTVNPWQMSNVDMQYANIWQRDFNDKLNDVTDNIVMGHDLSSISNAYNDLQRSTGYRINAKGEAEYDEHSKEGILALNHERGYEWTDRLDKMKSSGKIGDQTEWFNKYSTLGNYNTKRAHDPMYVFNESAPTEDVDFGTWADGFANHWNYDGNAWFVPSIDNGTGNYDGTRTKTMINPSEVESFYETMFNQHPNFNRQMLSEFLYNRQNFLISKDSDMSIDEQYQYWLSDDGLSILLDPNNDNPWYNDFENYKQSVKNNYKDAFMQKIGFTRYTQTMQQSPEATIRIGVGTEERIRELDAKNVSGVIADSSDLTLVDWKEMKKNADNLQTQVGIVQETYNNEKSILFKNLNDNLNIDLTELNDAFITAHNARSNPNSRMSSNPKISSDMIQYMPTMKQLIDINDETGQVNVAPTAISYLMDLGKTAEEVIDIANNTVNQIREVNTAANAVENAKWKQTVQDLEMTNIREAMQQDNEHKFNFNESFNKIMNIKTNVPKNIIVSNAIKEIIPDKEIYEEYIKKGINPFENNPDIENNFRKSMMELLDKGDININEYRTLMVQFAYSIFDFNAEFKKYNKKVDNYIDDGNYKGTQIIALSGGTDKVGIDAISKHFTDRVQVKDFDNWKVTSGELLSAVLERNKLNIDKDVTYESRLSLENHKPIMLLTIKGKNDKDKEVLITTKVDIIASEQSDFIINTKNELCAQWRINQQTNQSIRNVADIEGDRLVQKTYASFMAPDLYVKSSTLTVNQRNAVDVVINNQIVPVYIHKITTNQYQLEDKDGNIIGTDDITLQGDINYIGEELGRIGLNTDTDWSKTGYYGGLTGVNKLTPLPSIQSNNNSNITQ